MYEYNEAKQLEKLLKGFHSCMEEGVKEGGEIQYVTVHAGNKRIGKIMAGCPQFEGICKMVEHIAGENFYTVDFEKLTVQDSYPTVEEICIKALQYCLEQAKTSKIDILDMSDTANEYWLEEAIKVLKQIETEE